jgi:hypothetical protein
MYDIWAQNIFGIEEWASNKVFKGRPPIGTYICEAYLWCRYNLRMYDIWAQNIFGIEEWASNKVFKGRSPMGTYICEAYLWCRSFLPKISVIKIWARKILKIPWQMWSTWYGRVEIYWDLWKPLSNYMVLKCNKCKGTKLRVANLLVPWNSWGTSPIRSRKRVFFWDIRPLHY